MGLGIFYHGTRMKDYKAYQYIYNRTHEHEDFIEEDYVYADTDQEILKYGVAYFYEDLSRLYYPAKSYSVAIIYSYLISKNFHENFYEVLNDEDLFCGNDRFFTPYQERKPLYDYIIKSIALFDEDFVLNMNLEQISKTVGFFEKEFGISILG